MPKPRLSVDEQVAHMKEQGIKFEITSEKNAAIYLQENTYYFKLKAYAKLYEKYNDPNRSNEYVHLEFAYLQDLAVIDASLRKMILKIALDIEHYLKTILIKDFNQTDADGYTIIKEFIEFNPMHFKSEFDMKRNGKACSNLIKKYENDFAIWNIIEVLSFSDFQELFRYFYKKYSKQIYRKSASPYEYYVNPVRILRNAAAHNNCLINSIKVPYVTIEEFNNNPEVSAFLGKNGIKNKTLNTNMNKPLVHDFCVMLHLYHLIAPVNAQKHTFEELRYLFENRFSKHKDYYSDNYMLLSVFNFTKSVIELYCKLVES